MIGVGQHYAGPEGAGYRGYAIVAIVLCRIWNINIHDNIDYYVIPTFVS